jgi:arylsulfatase A-like enzyme
MAKKPKCVYIFQFDEVKYDHLSVYGYHRKQKNLDAMVKDGAAAFKQCIAGSSYTGAATPIMWTGMIGPYTGVRDPFHIIQPTTLAEYIRMLGWATQGCMSQSVAGSGIGMHNGFDIFVEPTDPNAPDTWGDGVEHWRHLGVHVDDRFHAKPVGKYYVKENIDFIKANKKGNFFLFNQYYETHTGSEEYLVKSGRLKAGVMAENSYYDAKIKLADEEVIGSVIETLKEVGLYDDALIIITGDHGTTLRRECWPIGDYIYEPLDVGELDNTHSSLYDVDLRIPFIIKYPGMPEKAKGQVIDGQVRSVDFVPTVLDVLGLPEDKIRDPFDGESVVPCLENLRGHGKRAYAETVWAVYGMGARQALREENWKYIKYASRMYEEFFDLKKDPLEQNNLIDRMKMHAPRWLQEMREQCNDAYRAMPKGVKYREMPEEEKKAIAERLRRLGYITE